MSLNIHPSLTFSQPEPILDGNVNFVSYKPSGTSTFGPGDSITVKMSSNTDYVSLDRSYIKFKLATNAIATLNSQGASSVFNTVQDQVSGLSLPVQKYHTKRGIELHTATSERKLINASCEQFTGTALGVPTTVSSVFVICMPVPTTLDIQDKLLPLCVLNAGHTITMSLNNANVVVTAGSYSISEFEIVCCMITPSSEYLSQIQKGLSSGSSLKLPVQLCKSITSTLSASDSQSLLLQVGYLSSINSVTLAMRTAALGPMKTGTNLQNFHILVDSQRYPKNKNIFAGVESFYQTIVGYHSGISTISVPDVGQNFHQYSWKSNGSINNGINSANGVVELNCDFTGSTPVAGSTIEALISYDGILLISQSSVSLILDL